MPRLIACRSCNHHLRIDEKRCPHCGAALRSVGGGIARTAGAILMGIGLSSCAGEGGSDATSAASSSGDSTESGSTSPASQSSTSQTSTSADATSSTQTSSTQTTNGDTFGEEAAYGVPDTGWDSSTDETGTGSGSSDGTSGSSGSDSGTTGSTG